MRARLIASLLAIALAGAACQSSGADGADPGPASTTSERSAASDRPQRVHPTEAFDAKAVVGALREQGTMTKPSQEGDVASSPLGVAPQLVCFDHEELRVWEYPTVREQRRRSAGIDPAGSAITDPDGGMSMVDWIGPPHFYAKGRIIVLYLGTKDSTTQTLTRILGPTVSPEARSAATSSPAC